MGLLINRKILLQEFFDWNDNYPQWACPTCKQSLLQIKNKTLYTAILRKMRESQAQAYYINNINDSSAYEGEESVFSCLFLCSNNRCNEATSCCGNVYFHFEELSTNDIDCCSADELNVKSRQHYYPKYFYPHLCLFEISELCPESVKQAIEESFATFFSSITATTNSIRISIEALLREHEIPSEDEKGRFISLHRRIESISVDSKLYPFKDQLLTLKYMGNDGSHNESEVSKEDIVDAYEVLSDILEKIYPEKKDINVALKRLDDKFRRKP